MTALIDSIYKTRKVETSAGEIMGLHSEISENEGQFLYNLIAKDAAILRTLEVGCAYGLSSLHICEALRGRSGAAHTIIDPFQKTLWQGVGIRNLERAGIGFYELFEDKSEFILPELTRKGEGRFDLIFIDGWHTFDHALMDAFYSLRLLKTGGILVLDDCNWISVDRVISYLSQYPCLTAYGAAPTNLSPKLLGRVRDVLAPFALKLALPAGVRKAFLKNRSSMLAFKKIAADERSWDWYQPF